MHTPTSLHPLCCTPQVVCGSWCPTMDLLALVTDDSQLSIHRLDWQKLWTAALDRAVTALCWRPDGEGGRQLRLAQSLGADLGHARWARRVDHRGGPSSSADLGVRGA